MHQVSLVLFNTIHHSQFDNIVFIKEDEMGMKPLCLYDFINLIGTSNLGD